MFPTTKSFGASTISQLLSLYPACASAGWSVGCGGGGGAGAGGIGGVRACPTHALFTPQLSLMPDQQPPPLMLVDIHCQSAQYGSAQHEARHASADPSPAESCMSPLHWTPDLSIGNAPDPQDDGGTGGAGGIGL